jgi:hypothetical protein
LLETFECQTVFSLISISLCHVEQDFSVDRVFGLAFVDFCMVSLGKLL